MGSGKVFRDVLRRCVMNENTRCEVVHFFSNGSACGVSESLRGMPVGAGEVWKRALHVLFQNRETTFYFGEVWKSRRFDLLFSRPRSSHPGRRKLKFFRLNEVNFFLFGKSLDVCVCVCVYWLPALSTFLWLYSKHSLRPFKCLYFRLTCNSQPRPCVFACVFGVVWNVFLVKITFACFQKKVYFS